MDNVIVRGAVFILVVSLGSPVRCVGATAAGSHESHRMVGASLVCNRPSTWR